VRVHLLPFFGDIANTKVLLDVLTGIAWEDDGQIKALHLAKFRDPNKPRVEIEVEPLYDIPAPDAAPFRVQCAASTRSRWAP
jgi:hypothetical protein